MAGKLHRRIFFIAVILAIGIILVSLYWKSPALKVAPEAVASMIDKGDIPTIIDVRNKFEYRRGHIPFSMQVALGILFFDHDELAVSQRDNVIVYCNSGFRARIASTFLLIVGFESVYIIEGQLDQWKQSGYPVIVGDERT